MNAATNTPVADVIGNSFPCNRLREPIWNQMQDGGDTWLQIVLEIGELARANHGCVALGGYRGKVHG
jgi:hypothetical protein